MSQEQFGETSQGDLEGVTSKVGGQPGRCGGLGKQVKTALQEQEQGLPWWSSGEESTVQCRGCGFDP